MKKTLWKDVYRSIGASKSRFISIMALMAIGSFALVGLKVTGPDMLTTGQNYADNLNTSDISISGSLGLNTDDQDIIDKNTDSGEADYGYLRDVSIKGTSKSFRIFSKPYNLSKYDLRAGRLPQSDDEIALDARYSDEYKLGDNIEFYEPETSDGSKLLKKDKFKIVGFLYSSEIISNVVMGNSTSGSGSLVGYGVVNRGVFDSDVYMIARLKVKDAENINPYTKEYIDIINKHKKYFTILLDKQAGNRLSKTRDELQDKIDQGKDEVANAESELLKSKNQLSEMKKAKDSGLLTSNQEKDYTDLESKIKDSEKEIKDNKEKLEKREKDLDNLELPSYSVNSRREAPAGEGFKDYDNIAKVVNSLANIFPVFLYFVAGMVTFTTMTRFVDEERTRIGIFRALGYQERDILKKFRVYAFASSLLGTFIGLVLGHIFLPLVVYSTYKDNFVFSNIDLEFYPRLTVIALVLSLICSMIPVRLATARVMKENTSKLMQAKAPIKGSNIALERIRPLWNRLSFAQKVTARNIFRYKKRMFMTILGVSGAVALLFAGLSVRHSISGIKNRQFGDIIRYDMIVNEDNSSTSEESKEVKDILDGSNINKYEPILYKEMTKIAGENKDKQEIKLIVPENDQEFYSYINLKDRKTGKKLGLSKDGVIISERLADLLNVKVSDTIKLFDENDKEKTMAVSGITEMYMGHFVFADQKNYEKVFQEKVTNNAYLVNLKDRSQTSVENTATDFMNLSSVNAVVQNTSLKNQLDILVTSLDGIMLLLIIIAIILTVVILYNLTNINLHERIRELSTIKVLGFYDREVTLYIYRETILLTLVGIVAGFGIGELLHKYIISIVPPDNVMFNPELALSSFLIPVAIILGVTFILGLIVNRKLRKLDMLEALKSVE